MSKFVNAKLAIPLALTASVGVLAYLVWRQRTKCKPTTKTGDQTQPRETSAEFQDACKFVSSCQSLTNEQKLELYAYFKQATVGPCNTDQPSIADFVAREKWNRWKALGNMDSDKAELSYHTKLREFVPSWQHDAEEDVPVKGGRDVHSVENAGFGVVVSCFAHMEGEEDESPDRQRSVGDALCQAVSQNNEVEVERLLAIGTDVNATDDQGRTALHFAVDRNNLKMLRTLLCHGANLDAQDQEGQTALHYACTCGHDDIAMFLINEGASLLINDVNGELPAAYAEGSLQAFIEAQMESL
eukprot:GILJ01001729.1.p1 GENE.GILJ01001729.1~~GILJ01001729.1.p1  ORF type:complete len:300 (+),score=44.76 GILJ01001729.1:26-925(+)